MSANEWQPIESAPQEREVIVSDGAYVCTAYQVFPHEWMLMSKGKDIWEGGDERGGPADLDDCPPTHWMPLPEPPRDSDTHRMAETRRGFGA
jgi:hypothetical protein